MRPKGVWLCLPADLGSVAAVQQSLRALVGALRLDRNSFAWMDINDRATGDALVLVAATRLVILLALGFELFGVLSAFTTAEIIIASAVNAAVFWLVYSGVVYAIVKYGFKAEANYATILRIAGFAYPTLILAVIVFRFGLPVLVSFLLSAAWFVLIVTHGVRYESELPIDKCALASVGGLVAWFLVSLILGRGLI